mmetsp:Transcript_13925/g.31350  ORF Transcript_13925/g.31350 Transcript_13925/m.31350 type:complete len:233 (-) Transcript_13925:713-1411(-)
MPSGQSRGRCLGGRGIGGREGRGAWRVRGGRGAPRRAAAGGPSGAGAWARESSLSAPVALPPPIQPPPCLAPRGLPSSRAVPDLLAVLPLLAAPCGLRRALWPQRPKASPQWALLRRVYQRAHAQPPRTLLRSSGPPGPGTGAAEVVTGCFAGSAWTAKPTPQPLRVRAPLFHPASPPGCASASRWAAAASTECARRRRNRYLLPAVPLFAPILSPPLPPPSSVSSASPGSR